MAAISSKTLNPEVQNEIVRDIVTHMYANVDKPSPAFISKVAEMLVDEYPFMSDSSEFSPAVSFYHYFSNIRITTCYISK